MLGTEPLCHIQPTPYGGRGVFAVQHIPKDTTIHVCNGPYAYVVYKEFRKEVCAYCFKYAFDEGRNAWNVRLEDKPGSGVWFCSTECRNVWQEQENVDDLVVWMNGALDKASKRMKPPPPNPSQGVDNLGTSSFESPLLRPEDLTRQVIDVAWRTAESLPLGPPHAEYDYLQELEVETARFLISGIVQRYREDVNSTAPNATLDHASIPSHLTWTCFLDLQNNEVPHLRSKPHVNVLASHLRIYHFLRRILHPALQKYVRTAETVRTVLSRDPGNVFGLWDMSTSGDSEMLGWGLYTSASYFNHDCNPNVKKVRDGRSLFFRTTRDVLPGEELCISYVDLQDSVFDRQRQLQQHWYFTCCCQRCQTELSTSVQGVSANMVTSTTETALGGCESCA
ncbi:SET domain-containing protein [Pluteus cervinus]|uniref:SET domain-containing protein n=1 Tax=Pluteus cervinus TaxID=181527 RepID=A0ACD3APK8_9AGAR|nr:SET domain-containing protein [Pluteus cervinus]